MFDDSASKVRACRAYLAFSALFFILAVGTGFVMAGERGYGAGPWNSHSVWSCNTPGGPYYLHNVPRSEQPCPSPYSTGLNGHGVLAKVDAPPHPR